MPPSRRSLTYQEPLLKRRRYPLLYFYQPLSPTLLGDEGKDIGLRDALDFFDLVKSY